MQGKNVSLGVKDWIPAFAGMTKGGSNTNTVIPANAGTQCVGMLTPILPRNPIFQKSGASQIRRPQLQPRLHRTFRVIRSCLLPSAI